jgi:hypothetical protein
LALGSLPGFLAKAFFEDKSQTMGKIVIIPITMAIPPQMMK